MTTANIRTIDPILASLAGRGLGLLFGSGLSLNPHVMEDCIEALKARFADVKIDNSVRHYYDFVRSAQEQRLQTLPIQEEIRRFYLEARINPHLNRVAKAPWKCVISVAEDCNLADSLSLHLNALPTSRTLTKIASSTLVPEGHTLPYFSLLGDITDGRPLNRLATNRSEYLARRRIWRDLVATAPDFLYGVPILIAGTLPSVDFVIDFLNEALGMRPTLSNKLLLLPDDPLHKNPEFLDLVKDRFQVISLSIGLNDIIEFLAQSREPIEMQTVFDFTDVPYEPQHLKPFNDQITRVPLINELSSIAQGETPRLLDILFSPGQLDWLPYKAKLDFPRDLSSHVLERCASICADHNGSVGRVIGLRGESGVGKTVCVRRIAFDLAQERNLVLWIKKSYSVSAARRWEEIIKAIEKSIAGRKCRVVFIYDDSASGNIAASDLLSLLGGAKFKWLLLLCIRNSDLANEHSSHGFVGWDTEAFVFPDQLSFSELGSLPAYLVSIGAAKDSAAAERLTASTAGSHSSDILCALWYLLPSTRAAISQSISDEYQRLGGFTDAVSSYAEAVHTKAGIARQAYEIVATTTGLNILVPVEVLVRALGIEYQEWIDMCASQKPIWGLIYSVPQPSSESFCFKTRNAVVTQVLLRLLNGGLGVRTGEFRCLKSLVGACSVGAPAYHGFLLDLLVRRRTTLSSIVSYEQGLELYDLAVEHFPRPDRSLLHHRALWIKDVGGHTAAAYAALEEAAQTPGGGAMPEPEEYVFTSMAATIVRAVKEQTMMPADALAKVEELLSKATRPGSLNLHNQHVHASLLLELAGRLRGADTQGFLSSLQAALRIVDHSLILLCPREPEAEEVSKDYSLMVGLRDEVINSHHNIDDAKAAAREVYLRSKNQVGFALVARKLISIAERLNKGSAFKLVADYIEEIGRLVSSKGDQLAADVVLSRAENYWRWRVNRRAGAVDWTLLRNDLEEVIASTRYRNDFMVMFWLAVSHFCVGDYGASESYFTRLRSNSLPRPVRHSHRCLLLDHQGNPRRLQVELQEGAGGRLFAYSSDLKTSVVARAPEFHGVDRLAAHAYVVFTMDGPLAVKQLDAELADRLPIDRTKR